MPLGAFRTHSLGALALGLSAAVLGLAACSGGGPSGGQALFGVTVLDGRGNPAAADQVVLIRDGRIAAVAPAVAYELPRGAQRVDLPGRFLMPGLVDVRVEVAPPPAAPGQSARVLRTLLAFGITTVGDSGAGVSGEALGPRVSTAGDAPASLQAVFGLVAEGSLRRWLAWLAAVELEGPEIEATIERLAAAGTVVAPGLLAIHTRAWGDEPRHREHPELHLAPPASRELWQASTALDDWTPEDFARAKAAWPRVLELTRRLHQGGVTLVAGSGFPQPWVIPGIGLHDELGFLRQAGIPPLEVLRIATYNGAAALGLADDTGSIEVGKAADLIVLAADPTVSPAGSRAITHVFLAGRYLDPSALLANLDLPRG